MARVDGSVRTATQYAIRLARPHDLGAIPAIEIAAAQLLDGFAPASVLNETTTDVELQKALRDGHLWVVLAEERPVGFAHVVTIAPDSVHLEEIDVHPDHGRRGLGTRLVTHVCDWAAAASFASVTLTTFRDVPWNMPFYARLGFEVVPLAELSLALVRVVAAEARRGLDPARRVVMRRRLTPDSAAPRDSSRAARSTAACCAIDV